MDNFVGKYNLPKLTPTEIETLNGLISTNEVEKVTEIQRVTQPNSTNPLKARRSQGYLNCSASWKRETKK